MLTNLVQRMQEESETQNTDKCENARIEDKTPLGEWMVKEAECKPRKNGKKGSRLVT
jgi:hypothetical protein